MSDKELQKLMDETHDACRRHILLLKKLEEEYKKRFGKFPSEVDDDYFIDSFMYPQGGKISVQEMTKAAKRYT